MNRLDGIIHDYRHREYRKRHYVPLAEKIKKCDILGKINRKITKRLNSVESFISKLKVQYSANPKFHLKLLSDPSRWSHYKRYNIFGPKTLKELYKLLELTEKQITEIELEFPFMSDDPDFYGASYEYIGEFRWSQKHQDNWAIFLDGIPQFHLMGNLWKVFLSDDGLHMRGKNIAIYINPKNINLVKTMTKIKASHLMDV